MGVGRKTQTYILNEGTSVTANQPLGPVNNRNLGKIHLGGVIFGCKSTTIKECLVKQLFGLPASHFSYIKNIDPGLPLFLFNYSERKLHGIFEAASPGQMNINPYAWTTDGSERTPYPAQVQIRIRLQSKPLPEEQFKPIILDNYFRPNHFWFELDHAQTSKLLSLLSAQAVAPSAVSLQNTQTRRTIFRSLPSQERSEATDGFGPLDMEGCYSHPRTPNELGAYSRPHTPNELDAYLHMSDELVAFSSPHMCNQLSVCPDKSDDLVGSMSLDANNHSIEDCSTKQVVEKDEELIYLKLQELALSRECSDLSLAVAQDNVTVNDHPEQLVAQTNSEERDEKDPVNSSDYASVIAQLVQEVVELKASKEAHIQKLGFVEKKMVELETEIGELKHRCATLESSSNVPASADVVTLDSVEHLELDVHDHDSLFLLGGYDGVNWLSTLDSYSPTNGLIRSLKPMSCIRSYASVVELNGEIYALGGGDGCLWHDTVESYDLARDQWTLRPSLSIAKGSLAGGTLNNKIFAIGGGNKFQCFADVEMLDLEAGRWISTQSMLEMRFALAAVELNGALYAVGGYDGTRYLSSVERFDPREHAWRKIENMKTQRGCHSMVVLNEKIYAVGGHDPLQMVPSVEIYDPRLGSWMGGEPMNLARGYSAAVVLNESIYVIGGIMNDGTIVDEVDCYQEGKGWEVIGCNAIGKRAFSSAIVL